MSSTPTSDADRVVALRLADLLEHPRAGQRLFGLADATALLRARGRSWRDVMIIALYGASPGPEVLDDRK